MEAEAPPAMKLPPPAKKVASAPVPSSPPKKRGNALLSDAAGIDFDESYSKDEKLLNEFIKRHPMLSMQATTSSTLQLVSDMVEKAHVKVPELEIVPKSHDDLFLAEPDASVGERPCVCGERCISNFVAKIRYGSQNEHGFVCKEFLLPSQHAAFMRGEGLPPVRQKCLLCARYWTNYIYILARSDANFKVSPSLQVQTFTNVVADTPEHHEIMSAASEVPTHASKALCADGYKPDAMLFVDEGFASTTAQRSSQLAALSFRPVVRFCSTHYKYCKDSSGKKRVVQVGVGVDDKLEGLSFQVPSSGAANPGAAKKATRKRVS